MALAPIDAEPQATLVARRCAAIGLPIAASRGTRARGARRRGSSRHRPRQRAAARGLRRDVEVALQRDHRRVGAPAISAENVIAAWARTRRRAARRLLDAPLSASGVVLHEPEPPRGRIGRRLQGAESGWVALPRSSSSRRGLRLAALGGRRAGCRATADWRWRSSSRRRPRDGERRDRRCERRRPHGRRSLDAITDHRRSGRPRTVAAGRRAASRTGGPARAGPSSSDGGLLAPRPFEATESRPAAPAATRSTARRARRYDAGGGQQEAHGDTPRPTCMPGSRAASACPIDSRHGRRDLRPVLARPSASRSTHRPGHARPRGRARSARPAARSAPSTSSRSTAEHTRARHHRRRRAAASTGSAIVAAIDAVDGRRGRRHDRPHVPACTSAARSSSATRPAADPRRPLDGLHAGRRARLPGDRTTTRDKAFQYTIKRNTVAVVSDGTAVLGLGDIGPRGGDAGDGGQGDAVQGVRRRRRLPDLPRHQGPRRDRRDRQGDRARRSAASTSRTSPRRAASRSRSG